MFGALPGLKIADPKLKELPEFKKIMQDGKETDKQQ